MTGKGDLKKEVILKVVDDIPELIPIDLLELIKEIQNRWKVRFFIQTVPSKWPSTISKPI